MTLAFDCSIYAYLSYGYLEVKMDDTQKLRVLLNILNKLCI